MSDLIVKNMVVGIMRTNCYIVHVEGIKEAIVIDPGAESERIHTYLAENNLTCRGILLTHGHFDHIIGVARLAELTHTQVYAHEAELALLQDPELNASTMIRGSYSLVPDVLLKDHQILKLAELTIEVIHTPGHTAGGVCYYIDDGKVLLSGDTLFKENIGRSDFPTGNEGTLIESIGKRLMILEDQVKVFPGHEEATTIGHERRYNIYVSRQSITTNRSRYDTD